MRGVGRLAGLARPLCCANTLQHSTNFSALASGKVRFAAGAPAPDAASMAARSQSHAQAKQAQAARGTPGLIGLNNLPLSSSSSSGGSDPAQGPEIELTAANASQVLQSQAPLLLQVGTLTDAISKKLGKLRAAAQGRLPLVKLDARALPSISQALQIKTEPTVFLMARGQVAAALEEDLAPQAVTGFVDKCAQMMGLQVNLAEGVSEQLAEAEEMEWTDAAAAEEVFKAVSEAADLPHTARVRAAAGMARCALRQGRVEEVEAAIQELAAGDLGSSPEVKQTLALQQLRSCEAAETVDVLKVAAEADLTDVAAVQAYAVALLWGGDERGAFDTGLALLKRKRSDESRKLVLMLLESLGPRHPHYAKARKKFSSAVFA